MPTTNSDALDEDLYQRTKALLEPGEVDLNGAIVHTDYDGQADVKMMQATIDVGDIIAEHSGYDPGDCYVYSGNDDPDFSSNQHQGLTLEDEEFVWECQQLLREAVSTSSFTTRRAPTTRRSSTRSRPSAST